MTCRTIPPRLQPRAFYDLVNAYATVCQCVLTAGMGTAIGNRALRATGITVRLKIGGTLENAAAMANHASVPTSRQYERRPDDISPDEVARIRR